MNALDFYIDSNGYNTKDLVILPNNNDIMQFPSNFSNMYLII